MKLKKRMTFDEMAAHLVENTGKVANRVTVGRYAKKLGYTVYKPMINRKIQHCYLNTSETNCDIFYSSRNLIILCCHGQGIYFLPKFIF